MVIDDVFEGCSKFRRLLLDGCKVKKSFWIARRADKKPRKLNGLPGLQFL